VVVDAAASFRLAIDEMAPTIACIQNGGGLEQVRADTNGAPDGRGFAGRWGPRVTNDPNTRRCGMKCPDFALLLLEAVAVKLADD
jgi:hypothetical protein